MIKEARLNNEDQSAAERLPYSTPHMTTFGLVRDLTAAGSQPDMEGPGVGNGQRMA